MTKLFVEKRKDVTQQELIDYFGFCQLLPGPSSTQTVTLIGYKRGGATLAVLTMIVWCLPAVLLMGGLSFFVKQNNLYAGHKNLFTLVQPMAIGFLLYATIKATQVSVHHLATIAIMIAAAALSIYFTSPWIFPICIVLGGVVSNFSSKRIPETVAKPRKIKWINLALFAGIFFIGATLSEWSRVGHWQHARLFNLFENFYRFGSMIWGGGHALMGALADQFITLQEKRHLLPYLSHQEFLTGFGMVSSVPGPVFSICSYMGGMATSQGGTVYQLVGCTIASVAIFLPSLLMVLFLFPLYSNLQQHVKIYRALEGIRAAVVGLMWSSIYKLGAAVIDTSSIRAAAMPLCIVVGTYLLLRFTKLPEPIIVLACLVAGYLIP